MLALLWLSSKEKEMLQASVGGIRFWQYTQSTPAATWNIYHAFGSKPMVDINVLHEGTIQKAFPLSIVHDDDNNLTITWSSPRTGYANLAATLAT
jgi:hypothetical protein